MGRRGPALLAALAVVALAVGCTSTKSGSEESTGDGKTKIGLVTKTDSNPYFVALRDAAKAEADKNGAELVALAGKFDGDNDGQVAAIENLVQQGAKTILVTPNNSTGILGAIKKARDRGVLVIALDTETDPQDAVDATIATDNTNAGRLQGQYVKAALNGQPARSILLDGTPGSTVSEQRHAGFVEAAQPENLGTEATNGEQNKAQQATENLLQRATTVNSIYTLNEPAARGAYSALKAKGLADRVVIGSIDGSCDGVEAVKSGEIAVTVMQFPKKMAEQGVRFAVEFAKSGKKPTGFVETETAVITDKPLAGIDSEDTAWGLENCWG
ncbi:substrate-binding domain-containing protein [Actinophytocola algeriensis]|uniref:Fructose transport system substrate-binding protein n=1 Tax=Actinophytocola algeriensis TaxID=1768010 RepID=A0A7W7QED3_9PSEU|nr:substrate-binding domain-containing protein [Actinophytocola algeriensis]MBB4911964.1 fructose transport system substrate-binding protein [Actinophytocola algeriensis]MBE1477544.1 fructose transport system substrate-binding protein [Actinophytocola algeriensis]